MAQSPTATISYPASHYVESAGAVQFVLPTPTSPEPKAIVVHYAKRNGYYLAKGRRNLKEPRAQAAIRETVEETGLACKLLPIRLHSRCPPEIEGPRGTADGVRTYDDVIEPFLMTLRDLGPGQVKIIWWYLAVVEQDQPANLRPEPGLTPKAMEFQQAVNALKYECDREIMRAAIRTFQETMSVKAG